MDNWEAVEVLAALEAPKMVEIAIRVFNMKTVGRVSADVAESGAPGQCCVQGGSCKPNERSMSGRNERTQLSRDKAGSLAQLAQDYELSRLSLRN